MYSISGTRSRMYTASAALSFPPDRLRMWRVFTNVVCFSFMLPPTQAPPTTPALSHFVQRPYALSPSTLVFLESPVLVHPAFDPERLLSGPPNHRLPSNRPVPARNPFRLHPL